TRRDGLAKSGSIRRAMHPRLASKPGLQERPGNTAGRAGHESPGGGIFRLLWVWNWGAKTLLLPGGAKGTVFVLPRSGWGGEGGRVIAGARDVGGELGALAAREAVRAVSIDLSAPDGPQALVAHAAEFGGLDILVNNVGAVAVRLDGFASVTDDQWQSSLNLNFMAAVRTTRAALTPMLKRGGGTIVTVSSVNAFLPDPGVIDYCAAKAALTNFSKALSKEVGSKGVRMNTVSP